MRIVPLVLLSLQLFLCSDPASAAEETSGSNRYVAGGQVSVDEAVAGDLLAAGGQVTVHQPVGADAAVAGGKVALQSDVAQDLRIAGGSVSIEGKVGGDLFAAGGQVQVGKAARVGGPAVIAGGDVRFDGQAASGLKIYGSTVRLAGQVDGETRLVGQDIALLPGARINGDLRYASPTELSSEQLAMVSGKVTREPTPEGWNKPSRATQAGALFHPFFFASMLVAGLVLLWLFPRATLDAAEASRTSPGRAGLLGLALLCTWIPASLLLVITLVGLPLGIALMLLFPLLLLLAYVGAGMLAGTVAARAMRREFSRNWLTQLAFLALGLLVLALVAMVPALGALVVLVAMFVAAGGWTLALVRRHRPAASAAASTA